MSELVYPEREYYDIRIVPEGDLENWYNRDEYELIAILPFTKLEPAEQPPSANINYNGNTNFGWSQTPQGQNFAAPSLVVPLVPQPVPLTHVVYYKYLFGKPREQVVRELRAVVADRESGIVSLQRQMAELEKKHQAECETTEEIYHTNVLKLQAEIAALEKRLQECHPDSVTPFTREKPALLEPEIREEDIPF